MERRQERQRGQPRRQELRARDNVLYASDSYCNGALRVNELPGQGVPLLGEEGWLRHQENAAKPPYKGADGVVSPGYVTTSTSTIMTTPSAPLRRLRTFLLLAQPPLLFQEGNTLSWQFIHTFIDRRYRRFSSTGRKGEIPRQQPRFCRTSFARQTSTSS